MKFIKTDLFTELLTWIAIFSVYFLWWIVLSNFYNIPFAPLFLMVILTFHGSVQHEILHGHPTSHQGFNNLLAFPGIFRGTLDCLATDINDEMKLAAAYAIADIIDESALSSDYIIPSVFNKKVVEKKNDGGGQGRPHAVFVLQSFQKIGFASLIFPLFFFI